MLKNVCVNSFQLNSRLFQILLTYKSAYNDCFKNIFETVKMWAHDLFLKRFCK